MYEIELAEPRRNDCPCCGAPQTILTRFIAFRDEPVAILQAALPEGRHAGRVDVRLSIGRWHDDPTPSEVVSFHLTLVASCPGYETALGGASTNGWDEAWGRSLGDAEARVHPRRAQAMKIVDAVVSQDPALADYLRRHRPRPASGGQAL